jgi:hypothetical protein
MPRIFGAIRMFLGLRPGPRPAHRLLLPCAVFLLLLFVHRAGAAPPAAAAPATAAAPLAFTGAGQVTLPMSEYEKLAGRPSLTVVDTLRIQGSFQSRDLSLSFSGRAAGLGPKVEVLSAPPAVSIFGCEGDAILAKSTGGVYELVPLLPRYTLRCRVATAGGDRLQVEVMPSVLWVESQVSDGELVASSQAGDPAGGRRGYSLLRISEKSSEILKPSATARYRITLQPDATLFTYHVDVMNPNRSHQPFTVELKSGEHVQKVDAAVSFEPNGAEYRFQIPPGEQTLVLSGTLPRPIFAPPVPASVHYLLIESHPLLRPNITALPQGAQQISAQETGLPTHFRGALGFLLRDGDRLAWQATRLEALRTTSFAVNAARHIFFLSDDGQALGESSLSLDNQGAPALSLPMRADPSYASLAGEPVLLTRDDSGQLWLPLAHGQQQVLVQHRQGLSRFFGMAAGALWLPELSVPASSASIELRYGREWVPIYEELAPEVRLPVLEAGQILLFLLLALWTERLLGLIGAALGFRLGVAALLSFPALVSGWWLTLLLLAQLLLSTMLLWPWLLRRKWSFWGIVGALTVAGCVCLVGVIVLFGARASAPMSKVAGVSSDRSYGEPPSPPKPQGAPGQSQYQGLPAKFVLPMGNEQSYYNREMLASTSSAPRAVSVLVLSRPVLGLVANLFLSTGILLLLLRWRPLRRGFFDRRQKQRLAPAAS